MLIAVDFDGTIAEDTHSANRIGDEIPGATDALKALHRAGHTLVIHTLRDQPCGLEGMITEALSMRLRWLRERGVDFMVLPRRINYVGWKLPFDLIIDDKANYPPKSPQWAKIAKSLGKPE